MSTTYTLANGAITQPDGTISLDWSPSAFTPSLSYDKNGETTSDDSFSFGAPDGSDSSAPYGVTWGDATQFDEAYDITLNYGGVTLTQSGGNVLQIDHSLYVYDGTVDLGDSGGLQFGNAAASFVLDGVLKGSGSESSVSIGVAPAITGSGTIIAVASLYNTTLTLASAVTDGISAVVTAGADLDFGSAVQSGVTVTVDDSLNTIVGIDDLADFHGTIAGLGVDASASNERAYIDLTQIASTDIVQTSIVDNTITLMGADGVLGTINLAGADYTGKYADWVDNGVAGTTLYLSDEVCFVVGTRILTPKGPVTVETISAGDEVMVVLDGEQVVQPVKWVGYRRLDLTRQKNAAALAPVRLMRGSLGENLPQRDLLVSPPHCMLIDGKLIPAKLLVNNMTIVRDTDLACVEYYHIELEQHAIIIAEGVETESYLDTGNRSFFSNAGLALMLHPEFHVNAGLRCWETDACAPLAVSPAAVYPAWKQLADRAIALGYEAPEATTTEEADIHLLADNRRVDPVSVKGQVYTFVVPRNVKRTVLASRSVVPSDLVPYLDDPRKVGIAVRKISVQSQAERQEFGADHPSLADGWHAPEFAADSVWRWTKGYGLLPVEATNAPAILEIVVAATTKYRIASPQSERRIAA